MSRHRRQQLKRARRHPRKIPDSEILRYALSGFGGEMIAWAGPPTTARIVEIEAYASERYGTGRMLIPPSQGGMTAVQCETCGGYGLPQLGCLGCKAGIRP